MRIDVSGDVKTTSGGYHTARGWRCWGLTWGIIRAQGLGCNVG